MALKVDYVVKETGTNLRRNLTLSFATMVTIAIALTLVGTALLMKQGVAKSNKRFHGDISTIVYMNAKASQEQVDAVGRALQTNPHVQSTDYLDLRGVVLNRLQRTVTTAIARGVGEDGAEECAAGRR